ncbi:MAG: TIGR04086 family membrane protein [Clostridia bacterium]|nr:TIGR04086 family membrane protein [Clostridia bacterium]
MLYHQREGSHEKADKAYKEDVHAQTVRRRVDRLWGGGAGHGVLALLLYGNRAGEGAVGPVNGILKVACPFIAGFFALKGPTERPALSGAIAGFVYDVVMVLLLCAFLGECHPSWALLGDLVISVATGMAGAMVRNLLWEYGRKK